MAPDTESRWRVAPILGAADVRKAVDYYVEKLGFECGPAAVFEPSGPDGAVYALLERGGADLHLQIRRVPNERERQRIERDVYFYVPDVDALHDELRGRGATIVAFPKNARYALRELEVVDLDGNRITFGSAIGSSS